MSAGSAYLSIACTQRPPACPRVTATSANVQRGRRRGRRKGPLPCPSRTLTRSAAVALPQEMADKKASQRTSSQDPYTSPAGTHDAAGGPSACQVRWLVRAAACGCSRWEGQAGCRVQRGLARGCARRPMPRTRLRTWLRSSTTCWLPTRAGASRPVCSDVPVAGEGPIRDLRGTLGLRQSIAAGRWRIGSASHGAAADRPGPQSGDQCHLLGPWPGAGHLWGSAAGRNAAISIRKWECPQPGHGDFSIFQSGLQSGVLSVFLLDTGNPVAMAECRRCPFWTFRWTPRLIQHTGCKTITKCGPRGWETATGHRCLARSWHLLVGWCRAAHRDAHVATVPSTQAHPPTRLHQAARPPAAAQWPSRRRWRPTRPANARTKRALTPSANVRGRWHR
jgi:hypothetical protein